MITAIRFNNSTSSSLYHPYVLLTSDTWSSFKPVTLQDIRALLGHIKSTSSLLDVLPVSFFIRAFDSIGRCIVEMMNTSLHTGSVLSFFKQAVVESVLDWLQYHDKQAQGLFWEYWCCYQMAHVKFIRFFVNQVMSESSDV